DVDGIHMDFIRYGGDGKTVGHWGYNAVSVARYNARYGTTGQPRWNDPRWEDWRRKQVTALVRRIYANATALKPKLIVSAATICWGDAPRNDADYNAKSAAYTDVFAPWRDWMREGILDLNCPMTYFSHTRSATAWRGWNTFVKDHQYGHLSALGVGAYLNTVPNTLAMVKDTRQTTVRGNRAAGMVLYCYDTAVNVNGREVEGDTALFSALPQSGVFAHDVPPPAMPWKERPTQGLILGTLLDGDELRPVDGAKITLVRTDRAGRRDTESDGNGRFAFVGLPAGSYQVTAAWKTGRQVWDTRVLPGQAARLTAIPSNGADSAAQVTGIGERPDGARVILGEALVTSGSDKLGDHFFVADGIGQAAIRVDAPHLVPPTVMGDKIVVSGTLHHTPGGAVLAAAAVRVVGMEIVK
ncbi:MAG: family 10 glycosylhydrolase, partial [Armatimonadota bacterium]|nr:family 10 glycosylhydrolase [Armatimonadota bacterium]